MLQELPRARNVFNEQSREIVSVNNVVGDFLLNKDSILIKVWVFKNYMDNKMINTWTQVKSYHGHFERSQTVGIIFDYNEEICIERTEKYQ